AAGLGDSGRLQSCLYTLSEEIHRLAPSLQRYADAGEA
ncbi:MAG: hypothetical protein RIR00_442, partial [Pseudomonadota bacterium]